MKLSKIEQNIITLEAGVSCPGTQIVRIQMDNSLVQKEGLKINSERDFTWVWSVGWGSITTPPLTFTYGNTFREAIQRAAAQKLEEERKV